MCQKGAGTKLHKLLVGLWFTFAWVNKIATTRSEGDDLNEGDDLSEGVDVSEGYNLSEAINIQLKQI